MIDKANIKIHSKNTKHINYHLNLDNGRWDKTEYNDDRGNEIYYENSKGYWYKREYDTRGKGTYYEDSKGYWAKREYDDRGNQIYYKNSDGIIIDKKDDRTK